MELASIRTRPSLSSLVALFSAQAEGATARSSTNWRSLTTLHTATNKQNVPPKSSTHHH
jgi:hypothetical protein